MLNLQPVYPAKTKVLNNRYGLKMSGLNSRPVKK